MTKKMIVIETASHDGRGYAWTVEDKPVISIAKKSNYYEALGALLVELSCISDLTDGVDLTCVDRVPDRILEQARTYDGCIVII